MARLLLIDVLIVVIVYKVVDIRRVRDSLGVEAAYKLYVSRL